MNLQVENTLLHGFKRATASSLSCNHSCKFADLNFCAKKLQDVNLKSSKTKKPIQAQIFQLDFSKHDANLLLEIARGWRGLNYILPIAESYCDMPKMNKFFAVAVGENNELKAQDIKSVAEIEISLKRGEKICTVLYVQAAPEIADNPERKIKGAGELAIYSAVKYAKDNDCKEVLVYSANDAFYDSIGFEIDAKRSNKSRLRWYLLNQQDYDWFLKRVEKKYGF